MVICLELFFDKEIVVSSFYGVGEENHYENLRFTQNKGGICIPNSTTELWTVDDVDLLDFFTEKYTLVR